LALGERFCHIIGYLMMFSVPESYAIEKSRCQVEYLLSDNYTDPMKLRGGTWFEPLFSMAVSKNNYYLNLPWPPPLLQSTPCPEIPYFIVSVSLTQIPCFLRPRFCHLFPLFFLLVPNPRSRYF